MSSSKNKSNTPAASLRGSAKLKVGRQRVQPDSSAAVKVAKAQTFVPNNTLFRGRVGSDVEKLMLSFISLEDLLRFHDASKDSRATVVDFLRSLKRLQFEFDLVDTPTVSDPEACTVSEPAACIRIHKLLSRWCRKLQFIDFNHLDEPQLPQAAVTAGVVGTRFVAGLLKKNANTLSDVYFGLSTLSYACLAALAFCPQLRALRFRDTYLKHEQKEFISALVLEIASSCPQLACLEVWSGAFEDHEPLQITTSALTALLQKGLPLTTLKVGRVDQSALNILKSLRMLKSLSFCITPGTADQVADVLESLPELGDLELHGVALQSLQTSSSRCLTLPLLTAARIYVPNFFLFCAPKLRVAEMREDSPLAQISVLANSPLLETFWASTEPAAIWTSSNDARLLPSDKALHLFRVLLVSSREWPLLKQLRLGFVVSAPNFNTMLRLCPALQRVAVCLLWSADILTNLRAALQSNPLLEDLTVQLKVHPIGPTAADFRVVTCQPAPAPSAAAATRMPSLANLSLEVATDDFFRCFLFPSLTELCLAGEAVHVSVEAVLRSSPNLKKLILRTPVSVPRHGDGDLKIKPTAITDLRISGQGWTDMAVIRVVDLCPKLRQLDVTGISANFLHWLSLCVLPKLRSLVAKPDPITACFSAESILACVAQFPKLDYCEINSGTLSDKGVRDDVIRRCRRLKAVWGRQAAHESQQRQLPRFPDDFWNVGAEVVVIDE